MMNSWLILMFIGLITLSIGIVGHLNSIIITKHTSKETKVYRTIDGKGQLVSEAWVDDYDPNIDFEIKAKKEIN